MLTFENLGLSQALLQAIADKKYITPSPIQKESIPAILRGGDLIACAQTGTGKTAGFTLPILEILSRSETKKSKAPRALILAPTRELAQQIHDSIMLYAKYLPL